MIQFEFTNKPAPTDIDLLTQKINEETSEYGEATSFAFFAYDEDEKMIGGCNGFVLFGEIYIDQLWVDQANRKSGIGKKLMEKVHDYGLLKNCTMVTVTTMSFQGALEFYQKLGYNIDFERKGYYKNSSSFYLSRKL